MKILNISRFMVCTVHTVMIIHLLDLRRVFSVLWILTSEQVEVFDLAIDPKDGLVRMRRDDLRTLCLVNCILDIALSVAASVILSLLLLSGDIEENPGPGGKENYH